MTRLGVFTIILCAAALLAQTAQAAEWEETLTSPWKFFLTGLAVDGNGVPYINGENAQHVSNVRAKQPDGTWPTVYQHSVRNTRDSCMGMFTNGNVISINDDVGRNHPVDDENYGIVEGKYGPSDTSYNVYDVATDTWGTQAWLNFYMGDPSVDVDGPALSDVHIFGRYQDRSSGQQTEFGAGPYDGQGFSGNPAYAYYDSGQGQWVMESVAAPTQWANAGSGHRIRVDSSGNPSVLFYNQDGGETQGMNFYSRDGSGTWTGELIPDTGGGGGNYPSKGAFAYYNDVPYVAWLKEDDSNQDETRHGRLYLSYKDGGAWTSTLLDEDFLSTSINIAGLDVDIDIVDDETSDFDGYMAISYSHLTDPNPDGDPGTVDTDGEARIMVLNSSMEVVESVELDGTTAATYDPLVDRLGYKLNNIEILPNGIVHTTYSSNRGSGGDRKDLWHAVAQLDSPVLLGDFDGNGAVNGLDIPGFKDALADPEQWAADNPDQPHPDQLGDFDGNGAFNGLDIPGFKTALAGTAVPEPATLVLLGLGAIGAIRRRRS